MTEESDTRSSLWQSKPISLILVCLVLGVTVLVPGALAAMLLAYQMVWLTPLPNFTGAAG